MGTLVRGQLLGMRRLPILLVLAAGLLVGCDPAPSTPLAPDKPAPPDASKLSSQKMDDLLKQNHATDRR